MPVSPARAAAFDILLRIEQEDAYASELLHSARYVNLSSADHAFATELVMGVLRWRSLLDRRIAEASLQGLEKLDIEVLTALRLGIYQMLYLERIPVRAAIHESVELVKRARKRSAAPFANAVLRTISQRQARGKGVPAIYAVSTTAELAEVSSHPPWLVERWTHDLGLQKTQSICAYDQTVPGTTIRLRDATVEDDLRHEGIGLAPGKLLVSARRVESGDVSRTNAFREGRIAIQDEASQLVAMLIGEGSRILDCCAAPGGKTSVLADHNPQSAIIAADLHPHRARLLRKLVHADNVKVLAADARRLPFVTQFDHVLVDVPCSGTGTLSRNPEIKWRLKPEDFANLESRQLAILQSAMSQVTCGGTVVYSTCSLECEENLGVVEKALSRDKSFRLLDCRGELERLRGQGELVWDDLDSLISGPYLRTIPGVHPCDGFFAAILEKN